MNSSIQRPSLYLREKRNLTDQQCRMVAELLLLKCENRKLKRGAIKEVAELFSVAPKIIAEIWKRTIACIVECLPVDVSSNMRKRVGWKRVQIDFDEVSKLAFRRRTNVRSLANALNMAKSTIHRRIKEGLIRRHTNALKLYLSEEEAEYYYLLPNEIEPDRTCKSKRFIIKVMFLTAVARPRYDAMGNLVFSGKICIFPFVYKEPAKRTSRNRIGGTMETKAVTSVTKDVIRSCLIENVFTAIRSKWPCSNEVETIYIQQDNEGPHIKESDYEFLEAATLDGFDIRLMFQPPNSPDMNVLDLGYFRGIQSLQHQEAPATIDELVKAVEKSFQKLSPESLNCVFLSLQSCMTETMKCFGGNKYKLPHMGKKKLARTGDLLIQLTCDRDVVQSALAHLQNDTN